MIQCPWCAKEVELQDNICPSCKHEVLLEHLDTKFEGNEESIFVEPITNYAKYSIEETIAHKYKCSKCDNTDCYIKEVAMSGTGLSKIFDIDYNHYLFVSCTNCGFVEVYNPDILRGHKSGQLGTIMDILFG